MAEFINPIIVVGTGRSGTSSVAGMLHFLGIHMGDRLQPASEDNPGGHFEDLEFYELNRQRLDCEMEEEKFMKTARYLIHRKGIQGRAWGWKYPSTSNLIDKYLEIVPDAKVIWCGRPLDDAVESCEKAYDHLDFDDCKKLLGVRAIKLSETLNGSYNTLRIKFEDIYNDTEDVVDTLVDFCDLDVTEEQRQKAVDFIFDPEATKDAKILLAIPSAKLNLHAQTHNAIKKMESDKRYEIDTKIIQNSPVSHSRNNIAKFVREDDYDFVIMMDDDVAPTGNPLDLIKLNKDILILPTPTYQNGRIQYNVVSAVPGKGGRESYRPIPGRLQVGLMEIDGGGAGLIILKREVLEKIKKPFEFEYNEDGIKTRGEDFNFCKKAREVGYKIWTHFDYPCEHWNTLNLLKIMNAFRKTIKDE